MVKMELSSLVVFTLIFNLDFLNKFKNFLSLISFDLNKVYKLRFLKNFFIFFKKIYSNKYNSYDNNLNKSFIYHTTNNINNYISNKNIVSKNKKDFNFFLDSVELVNIRFNNNPYNKIILNILYILNNPYQPILINYSVIYNFFFLKKSLYSIFFINYYYFKVRNF